MALITAETSWMCLQPMKQIMLLCKWKGCACFSHCFIFLNFTEFICSHEPIELRNNAFTISQNATKQRLPKTEARQNSKLRYKMLRLRGRQGLKGQLAQSPAQQLNVVYSTLIENLRPDCLFTNQIPHRTGIRHLAALRRSLRDVVLPTWAPHLTWSNGRSLQNSTLDGHLGRLVVWLTSPGATCFNAKGHFFNLCFFPPNV